MTEQTYFQEYWKKKRDIRNAARRQRYKKDAAYRSKAQRRARSYWRKKKAGARPVDQTVVVATDGSQYSTVGRVAASINRSTFTVREYCRSGVIPAVTFYGQHGARLFSPEQVDVIIEAFRAFDVAKLRSLAQVAAVIERRWKDGKKEASC